jgi:hypothetical protein
MINIGTLYFVVKISLTYKTYFSKLNPTEGSPYEKEINLIFIPSSRVKSG